MPSANCSRLFEHITADKEFGPLLRSSDREAHRVEWRAFIAALRSAPPTPEQAEEFHQHWHVCHHFVRELVEDDAAILDALRVWLPPYDRGDLVLYRGENLDRLGAGRLGWAWTDSETTARMFASGLNAAGAGGALLRAAAPAAAVIAGPSRHSQWLGESEFTVDTRHLDFEVLARFAPLD